MIPPYVKLAQEGDEGAWATLHERHHRAVLRVAGRIVGPEHADDVAQDTFLRLALGGLKQFRGDSAFSTWLYRAALNTSLMWLRTARSRLNPESLDSLIEDFGEFHLPVRDGRLDKADLRRQLRKALSELPPGRRHALILHDIAGYTYTETARILGVGVGGAKSQVSKAHTTLRKKLGGKR